MVTMRIMNEISKYFKEEWNKAVFNKKNCENEIQIIDNELSKLIQQQKNISEREDDPDYVFQVDYYEKNMDEQSLNTIILRKEELEKNRQQLEKLIVNIDLEVEKTRHLYNESIRTELSILSNEFNEKIRFIIQLMDNDIQRAKVELTNLLKEENTDAY